MRFEDKMENISNKVKSNSELHVSLFFQSILTVRLIHDIGTKSVSVKSGRGWSLSDACELMPQTGWQDALHFLHDEVQRSKQGAKKGFSEDSHELGELVCEEGQHGSEGAETSREQDEEWQFLLRVHRHLMKHCW